MMLMVFCLKQIFVASNPRTSIAMLENRSKHHWHRFGEFGAGCINSSFLLLQYFLCPPENFVEKLKGINDNRGKTSKHETLREEK